MNASSFARSIFAPTSAVLALVASVSLPHAALADDHLGKIGEYAVATGCAPEEGSGVTSTYQINATSKTVAIERDDQGAPIFVRKPVKFTLVDESTKTKRTYTVTDSSSGHHRGYCNNADGSQSYAFDFVTMYTAKDARGNAIDVTVSEGLAGIACDSGTTIGLALGRADVGFHCANLSQTNIKHVFGGSL